MTTPLLAVDQVLTTLSNSLKPARIEDYALSMVYTNAAARVARNGAGPSSDTAQAFQAAWMKALGDAGWVITSAGTGTNSSSSGDGITLADQLSGTAPDTVSPALGALKSRVRASSGDALVSEWWSAATGEDFLQAAIGTLEAGSDAPVLNLTAFSVDLAKLATPGKGWFGRDKPYDATSAKTFFVKFDPTTVDIPVTSFTATLDEARFGARRDAIRKALGAKFADHYVAEPAMAF